MRTTALIGLPGRARSPAFAMRSNITSRAKLSRSDSKNVCTPRSKPNAGEIHGFAENTAVRYPASANSSGKVVGSELSRSRRRFAPCVDG